MTCHEHDLSLVDDNHVCIKMNAPMCQQDQCANVSRAHQMVQKCEKAEMVQNVKRKRTASTCAVLSLTCRFSPQVQAKTSAGVDVLESLSRQVPGGKDISHSLSRRTITQSVSKDTWTLCVYMSLPLKCPSCPCLSSVHSVSTCPCLSSVYMSLHVLASQVQDSKQRQMAHSLSTCLHPTITLSTRPFLYNPKPLQVL